MSASNGNKKLIYGLLIAALAALIFLYLTRRVVTPFIIAFGLAYLMDPLVDRLESCKLSRTFAVILLLFSFAIVTSLGAVILVPLLKIQVESLAQNLPDYMSVLQGWLLPLLENLSGWDEGKLQELMNVAKEKIGTLPLELIGLVTGFFWSSLASLMNLLLLAINVFIIPVAMFYLLRDFDEIMAKIADLFPPRWREQAVDVFRDIDRVLSRFVRGQLMVATCMAVLYSIGLYLCGTPMSLVLGLLAGYANLVPYLGLVFGLLPALLLTFLQFQEVGPLLAVTAVFLVVQALEGMIITPRVVGDQIGLHPVIIMLAVLVGAELFGLMGLFLAVPIAAILKVLMARGLLWYKKSDAYT